MNDKEQQQFKTSLVVTGMTCATCSRMVERSLVRWRRGLRGGEPGHGTAFVVSDRGPKRLGAVEKAGYSVSEERAGDRREPLSGIRKTSRSPGWYGAADDADGLSHGRAARSALLSAGILRRRARHLLGGTSSIRGVDRALASREYGRACGLGLGGRMATAAFAFAGFPVVSFGCGRDDHGLHITGRYIESPAGQGVEGDPRCSPSGARGARARRRKRS